MTVADLQRAVGPVFWAVHVLTRDDGIALYLGDAPDRGCYRRETLDRAARFRSEDTATTHLEVFPELHARVVALNSVIRERGNWRGWHSTRTLTGAVLHAPEGWTVESGSPYGRAADTRPWSAWSAEGVALKDQLGRPRAFSTPLAARVAMEKRLRDVERTFVEEARQMSAALGRNPSDGADTNGVDGQDLTAA